MSAAAYQRPLPVVDASSAAFWTSGRYGPLRLQRCGDCGSWQHPAQPVCKTCFSRDLAFEAVSGRGAVYSFTLNMKAWAADMVVPYVIAVIELDEQPGLRFLTRLTSVAPEAVVIGMSVELYFERDEDVWLPMARPAGPAAS